MAGLFAGMRWGSSKLAEEALMYGDDLSKRDWLALDSISEAGTGKPVEEKKWEWAVVEIFGHRRHAGRAREDERFGAKMLRIDVPVKGDPTANGWETHWYGGSSIFSYTLTDEESVMRINKPYESASPYRLSSPAQGDDYYSGPIDEDSSADEHDLFSEQA